MKKTATALQRTTSLEQTQTAAAMPQDAARKIALAWMDMQSLDTALMDGATGIMPWRAAPQVQNAAAAAVADLLDRNTSILTCGFQPHAWMIAAGQSMSDVACIHLGKKLPANVMHLSAEDIAANFKRDVVTIVAMHIETSNGWNNVRTISAAAVNAETPMLMVVSTAVAAPEGVTINVVRDLKTMTATLRDAVKSVRDMGTIRVVAVDDMTVSAMERELMEMSGFTPESWIEASRINNDGADKAMNIAYQAPVESF